MKFNSGVSYLQLVYREGGQGRIGKKVCGQFRKRTEGSNL